VNNFTNHMYTIAYDLCEEHNVPFDILKPLILETSDKIKKLTPKDAQTGPANYTIYSKSWKRAINNTCHKLIH